MSEDRNEATGQFTAPPEQLFGREEELVRNGYTVRKDDAPAEQETYGSDDASLRQAAEDLAAKRGEADVEFTPSELIAHRDPDPLEAVTVAQAAADRSMASSEIKTFTESMDLAKFAEEIDAKRAKLIDGNPKAADVLGLSPEEVAAAKAAKEAAKEAAEGMEAKETAEPSPYDAIEGLEPELKEVLKKSPQARQYLEEIATEGEQVKQAYTGALEQGQQVARATIAALAPQLDQIPLEHWGAAIQQIAATDPVRGKLVIDTLQNWSAIQERQQLMTHHQQQIAHQNFETLRQQYSRQSDEVLGPMTVAEKTAMAEDLVKYVGEYGVTREQLVHEAKTNLALNHPAFQKMAADALKFRAMQKSAKAVPTRQIPPVQRPGTSGAARVSDSSSKLATLQSQLSNATGDKAVRLAAQISKLRRSA
jgi:hypothetical protein